MHKLCEYIDEELKNLEKKVGSGGDLNEREIEYGKNLAKFKMALLTNEAMEKEGYSNDYRGGMSRGHSMNGRSYDDMSYARGRTGNVRRDSMGRYSGDYSYAEAKSDMISGLHELMKDAPDEETKREFKSFISRLEKM